MNIYIYGWWFGSFFVFPYIGNVIVPSDEVIVFRGVGILPTSIYIQLSHVKTSMFGKNCLIFRKRHQTFPNRWVCLKQGIPYPQFQWIMIILVYLISNPNDGQVVVISYPMAYPHVHIQRLKQCFSSASIVIYGDLLKIHKIE